MSHENAIKQIVHYLECMADVGLILHSNNARGIQCFIDADFAGSWSQAEAEDASCAYPQTGYVITFTLVAQLYGSPSYRQK